MLVRFADKLHGESRSFAGGTGIIFLEMIFPAMGSLKDCLAAFTASEETNLFRREKVLDFRIENWNNLKKLANRFGDCSSMHTGKIRQDLK